MPTTLPNVANTDPDHKWYVLVRGIARGLRPETATITDGKGAQR